MKKFVLAGNPNSGKTTLFNTLTGSTAHVGNWPGVTVDKKEGFYKKEKELISIMDLPGIYSLSPYTPEEVIARNYILNDEVDYVYLTESDNANERVEDICMEMKQYLTKTKSEIIPSRSDAIKKAIIDSTEGDAILIPPHVIHKTATLKNSSVERIVIAFTNEFILALK